jgi:hypothetical protein
VLYIYIYIYQETVHVFSTKTQRLRKETMYLFSANYRGLGGKCASM